MESKDFYQSRSGSMEQFCGIRRSIVLDGKGTGVETVDLWNNHGIALTCYPGRGMDLGRMAYKGIPLSYHAKPGLTAPGYYESGGMNWLRGFFGGMMTTCGLSNVGGPETMDHPVIGRSELGLHGRISHTAAEDVCIQRGWQGDDYSVSVSGRLREACLHAENLTLTRTIRLSLDASRIVIDDVVRNESYNDTPLMLLYHINVGYPMLDKDTVFFADTCHIRPYSPAALADPNGWKKMGAPVPGTTERVYFHQPAPDKEGWCMAGLHNPRLDIAFFVRFRNLNSLTQWRMENLSEYVLGIEPGNCHPIGRSAQQAAGELEILPPWGEKHVSLELGVAEKEDIRALWKGSDRG